MKAERLIFRISALCVVVLVGWIMCPGTGRASEAGLSMGQTVYVPLYNAIRIGPKGSQFPLAATLCIRNTDLTHAITLISVDHYGSDGTRLRQFLSGPAQLAPLATTDFFITSSDMSGGLYPSFIVRWKASTGVSQPVIEAIIIGDRSGQGISFISSGRIIKED